MDKVLQMHYVCSEGFLLHNNDKSLKTENLLIK